MIFQRGSLVIWSCRTNEHRVWHSFGTSNIARMNFTVSSTELRDWRSIGVVGWDAVWAHVLCCWSGKVGGLKAGKWACLKWKAGVVTFGRHSCRWCRFSCWYEGQSVKLAGWAPPQLTHFGGVPMGCLHSRVTCGWLHLTHFGDLPQTLDDWSKDWQLKNWCTGLLFLYFSHRMM
jgi:hypothetical protein